MRGIVTGDHRPDKQIAVQRLAVHEEKQRAGVPVISDVEIIESRALHHIRANCNVRKSHLDLSGACWGWMASRHK
jgi:hypothetical protein